MEIIIEPGVEKFIRSLENPTSAKVVKTIALLETFGSNLTFPHSKKISGKLFELRTRGKIEIRIFYIYHLGSARLLHAFVKKTQKTPHKEIQSALTKLKALDTI